MTIEDVKKYLSNKIVMYGVVALLLCGATYSYMNTRAKLAAVRSELLSSQVLNSIIEAEKHRLDSLIGFYRRSVLERDSVIKNRDKKISKQIANIVLLEGNLQNALAELNKVPADSSYSYINLRVKPTSELKYKFDSTQVKKIHYTFLERDGLARTNLAYSYTTGDLLRNSMLKDKQISELNSLTNIYLQKGDLCKKENEAYIIEIDGLNKDVKKQKLIKTLLIPPAAVGVIAVVVKIFTK
jgi:hypothetical protein